MKYLLSIRRLEGSTQAVRPRVHAVAAAAVDVIAIVVVVVVAVTVEGDASAQEDRWESKPGHLPYPFLWNY